MFIIEEYTVTISYCEIIITERMLLEVYDHYHSHVLVFKNTDYIWKANSIWKT